MAWHFVRLKFRLTGRLLSGGSTWSLIGTILVWAFALMIGIGGGALVAAAAIFLDRDPAWAVVVGVTVQALWVIVPVVATALDATVNPRWFELLPLSSGELSRGLLAAAVAGPGGLATFLFIAFGLGWGYWPGWWGIVLVPVTAGLATFLGVALGRLVTVLLSDLLSRRTGAVLGPLMALGIAGVGLLASGMLAQDGGPTAATLFPDWTEWMAVIPGGAVGLAMAAFTEGQYGLWIAVLAWAVGAALVLAVAHGRAVERLSTRAVTQRSAKVRGGADVILGDRIRGVVPAPDLRVAAAKDGRYLRRDPRLRAQLLGGVVTVAVFGVMGTALMPRDFAPFVAVAVTWAAVSSLTQNQFGVDAGSMWAYVASPNSLATALVGKNIMWGLVAAPLALLAGVGGALVAGSARYMTAAILVSVAVAVIWITVGNMTSIFGAYPMPERQVFSTGATGGRAIVVSLVGLAVATALSLPIGPLVIVVTYFGEAWGATLAGLVSVAYAAMVFHFGFRWARAEVVERQYQILEALDQP